MKTGLRVILAMAAALPLATSAAAYIDLTPVPASDLGVRSVEASYEEKGHLFALVPLTFEAKARAHASGGIELEYPWYSMFMVDKRDKLASELGVAVKTALNKLEVGKVRAEGGLPRLSFSAEEESAVSAAMEEVLRENFETRSGS